MLSTNHLHLHDPTTCNVLDVEDTAEKLDILTQVVAAGRFAGVVQMRLLSSANTWRRRDTVQVLPAGDLGIKVICLATGEMQMCTDKPLVCKDSVSTLFCGAA